jgi:hypothetical protein
MAHPPRMTDAEAAEFRRRQRGRNIAMLLVLIGLSALFFAITIVKMTHRSMDMGTNGSGHQATWTSVDERLNGQT